MSAQRHVTADSFTQDHALQIVNSIGVRDGKLAIIEGEETWRALRAAQRVLDHHRLGIEWSLAREEALIEATSICVAWWNAHVSSHNEGP